MECTHLSAKAFRFGLRAGSKRVWTPPDLSVARKEAQNLLSRSCSAKRIARKLPSMSSTALRAICVIHCSVGCLVIPAMVTRRVSRCKKNRTSQLSNPRQVSTSTVKKSMPAKTAMWERMKSAQFICCRRWGVRLGYPSHLLESLTSETFADFGQRRPLCVGQSEPSG
jgi:hypothetical protein